MFFSPFSIAITSLGEERASLSAFRTFVRFVLVWFCLFPLPLRIWEWLQLVVVALPKIFSCLFCVKLYAQLSMCSLTFLHGGHKFAGCVLRLFSIISYPFLQYIPPCSPCISSLIFDVTWHLFVDLEVSPTTECNWVASYKMSAKATVWLIIYFTSLWSSDVKFDLVYKCFGL